jgi:L-lactate utilization protein LutC
MNTARDEILGRVRAALGRGEGMPPPAPPDARVPPRRPGDAGAEIDRLLAEIGQLGGKTQRVATRDELRGVVEDLVAAERVSQATMWAVPELHELGITDILASLGVTLVSPHADRLALAGCDLGVTGVDAVLPETGTLLLRSSAEQPRLVSLLPRVLLAIVRRQALRADLHDALAGLKGSPYCVCITGPSRFSPARPSVSICTTIPSGHLPNNPMLSRHGWRGSSSEPSILAPRHNAPGLLQGRCP